MEAISLPPDYPPSEIWLIHDFMSLSKNEMKYPVSYYDNRCIK